MASSTGDIKNNIIKLLREITRMKLPIEPNIKGLCNGVPTSYLPILHSALMDYSLPLTQYIVNNKNINMYCKTDLKFIDGLYKVMRDVFNYRPQLTREQFLSNGNYTERKIILTYNILVHCQILHKQLRPSSNNSRPSGSTNNSRPSGGTDNPRPSGSSNNSRPLKTVITDDIYIPLSPPQTPLIINELVYNDPTLHVTPLTTPLTTPLKPVNGRTMNDVRYHHTVKPHPLTDDKLLLSEPNVINDKPHPLNNDSNENIIPSEHDNCTNTSDNSTVSSETPPVCLNDISQRMDQLSLLIEQLNGRLIILETHVKINSQHSPPPTAVTMVTNVSTQTEPLLATPTSPIHLSPHSPIIGSTPSSPMISSTPSSPIISSTPHHSNNDNTLLLINNLRDRVRHTKTLLKSTHHSSY